MKDHIQSIENPPGWDAVRVFLDDEIYDRHTQDTDPQKHELGEADFESFYVLGGYVNRKIASLFLVKDRQVHFYCLKKFRGHARELLRQALFYHGENIFCEIPVLYREVINFAKKEGFKKIGEKKSAWLKNGKMHDVEVLAWAA